METFDASPQCPFCGNHGRVLFRIKYRETAEANSDIGDAEGGILSCDQCGIAYPNLAFSLDAFAKLYAKSLDDLTYFDDSLLQRVRRGSLTGMVRRQWADPISLALQIPVHSRLPKRVLDVGCGFGEFSKAYQALGAQVTATEVIPSLVARNRKAGIDCLLGEIETLSLPADFDLILFRAVLYRTRNPSRTLATAAALLAPGGAISVIDPCVDEPGVRYFACKQFPQGRYYITDFEAYSAMLRKRFGLMVTELRRIYGRPEAPLHRVRLWGNIKGFGELLINNLARRKPYTVAYLLTRSE